MKAIGLKLSVCALAAVAMIGCASDGGGGGMSDEDAIMSIVEDAMTALAAQDIKTMVSAYADSFESDQGGGTAEMVEFLEGAQEQGFLDDIEISLDNLVITVDGTKGSAKPIDLEGAFGTLTLEFELEKIDGTWMVTYQAQY